MDDPASRNAIEWVEGVNQGEISNDDPSGPNDGDCYLMAGAANRCLAVAGALDYGDVDEIHNSFNEMIEFLTDDADTVKLAQMATTCRKCLPKSIS